MNAFLLPTPAPSPGRTLTPFQRLQRARASSQGASSKPTCTQEISIGVFFDGTNNNKKRDQEDVANPDARSHSNVVVLHDTFATPRAGHYRIYIPGVGTPFPEIGELTESSTGKAMARGGEARIFWAMIQLINAIHRAANQDVLLLQNAEAKAFIGGASALAANNTILGGTIPTPVAANRRRGAFHGLGQRLEAAIKDKRPGIRQANVSVFGFSRGAAEARTFCNWMLELCDTASGTSLFYGVPLRFQFVGLFDTVASVGLANSSPVPNDGGFMGWADGTLELPAEIERCVHYTAAHEIRKSFPLSTVRRSRCKFEEYIYPGAHSDVGGGYAPGEQGKGQKRSELLSQVPLVHMYLAARAAGVPLMDAKELDSSGRSETVDDLELAPKLATRFNEYRRIGPGGGEIKRAIREHLRWYWRWRLSIGGVESLPSFQAASDQDKIDLAASEMDFKRDLAQAESYEATRNHLQQHPNATTFSNMGLGVSVPANLPELSTAEQIALAEKRSKPTVPPLIAEFFDQHVHDSHASFYLVGPTTAYDRKQMIEAVAKKQKEGKRLNGFERRVAEAQKTKPGAFPEMTDRDYEDLLKMDGLQNKAIVKWMRMSATRRESEGHVRDRVIFDRS